MLLDEPSISRLVPRLSTNKGTPTLLSYALLGFLCHDVEWLCVPQNATKVVNFPLHFPTTSYQLCGTLEEA